MVTDNELFLTRVRSVLREHVPHCDVCVAGVDRAELCLEISKELRLYAAELHIVIPEPVNPTEFIIRGPPVFEKVIIPSRQRKPWSKRYKGGRDARDFRKKHHR